MAVRRAYRLITGLLLVITGCQLRAQASPDFATVDSVSYNLYSSAKWTRLEAYCDYAIHKGYDYYYLRIRAGIAAFEKKKYRIAAIHFEKALLFSTGDALANEYLYYSYLYAGYYEKARWLSRSFDSTFAAAMKTSKLCPVEFVSLEAAQKISDTSSRFKTASYVQLAVKHYIGRRLSLYHAATYYKQDEFRFQTSQFQYYLNATLPLKHNFILSAGFHAIYDNATIKTYSVGTTLVTHTSTPGGPPPPPPTEQTTVMELYTPTKIFSYIGSAELTRRTRWFDLSAGTTISSLDTAVQLQLNGGIGYYPFGNNTLIVGSQVYFHTIDLTHKKVSVAVAPYISAQLTAKISLSVSYFNNNGVNIVEQNGYQVNNSLDFTTERYTASLSYALFKKMYIYTVCGRENKKELVRDFKYNYNIFLLGIRLVPS